MITCSCVENADVLKSICFYSSFVLGVGVKSTKSMTGPLSRLADTLRHVPDLERGLTRLLHRPASPSELVATMAALRDVSNSVPWVEHYHTRDREDG